MLFYYVTACIAILSYLRAKDTILAPLRTELFKLQISELEAIIDFFNSKSEHEHMNNIMINEIYRTNFTNMVIDFSAICAVNLPLDVEKIREQMDIDFPCSMITKNYYENNFTLERVIPGVAKSYAKEIQLAEVAWGSYIYGHIRLPKETIALTNKLEGWCNNPLIKSELRKQIKDFKSLVNKSIVGIAESITLAAQEMPKVRNWDEILKDPLSLISIYFNNYNHSRESFELAGNMVMKSVCDCYDFDNIF